MTLRYGRLLSAPGGEHALRFHDLTLQLSREEGTDVLALLRFSVANLRAEATGPLPRWMPQVTEKGRLRLQAGEMIFDKTVLHLGDLQVRGKGRVRHHLIGGEEARQAPRWFDKGGDFTG